MTRLLWVAGLLLLAATSPRRMDPPRAEDRPPLPRVCEGRLSGQMDYAPFEVNLDDAQKLAAARFRDHFRMAHHETDSPQSRANLGVGELAYRHAWKAVDHFEAAVAADPANAAIRNDLGVAYLARARQEQGYYDLVRALDEVSRASELAPHSMSAQFNRALLLQALNMRHQAAAAWQDYLSRDNGSPWSAEANNYVRILNMPPENPYTERLGHLTAPDDTNLAEIAVPRKWDNDRAVRQLLYAWAVAYLAGDHIIAQSWLAVVEKVGRARAGLAGDLLLEETLQDLRTMTGSDREQFATGLVALSHGVDDYQAHAIDRASAQLQAAFERLTACGSPLAVAAQLGLAHCFYQQFQYDLAQQTLVAVIDRSGTHQYPAMLGSAWWVMGLIQAISARPAEAHVSYGKARRILDEAGLRDEVSAVDGFLADNLAKMAGREETWLHRLSGLRGIHSTSPKKRAFAAFYGAARDSARAGHHHAAVLFAREAMDIALAWDQPVGITSAWIGLASVHLALGQRDVANEELRQAAIWAEKIETEGTRLHYLAEISRIRGTDLLARGDPQGAIDELTRTATFFEATDYDSQTPALHMIRARAYLALGDIDKASHHFDAALTLFESLREQIPDPTRQRVFHEQYRRYNDEAVRLKVDRRRPDLAFLTAERARSRLLVDRLMEHEGFAALWHEAWTPSSLNRRVAPEEALVCYNVQRGWLYIWVIQPQETHFVPVRMEPYRIDALARACLQSIAKKDRSSFEEVMADLYSLVLAPIEDKLQDTRHLVLVPDRALFNIPFAALRDSEQGTYLCERFTTILAPSAYTYLGTNGSLSPFSLQSIEDPLLVGAMAKGPASGGLDPLSFVDREIEEVGALFERPVLLDGRAATKARILREIANRPLFHFAGHAQINLANPDLSFLRLAAGSGDEENFLYAHEIAKRDLSHLRLAVLSACSTGAGAISDTEGQLGLARAFLLAGAQMVLANGWQVDDQPAQSLMVAFYEALDETKHPREALRHARMTLIEHPDPKLADPFAWASPRLWQGGGTH